VEKAKERKSVKGIFQEFLMCIAVYSTVVECVEMAQIVIFLVAPSYCGILVPSIMLKF